MAYTPTTDLLTAHSPSSYERDTTAEDSLPLSPPSSPQSISITVPQYISVPQSITVPQYSAVPHSITVPQSLTVPQSIVRSRANIDQSQPHGAQSQLSDSQLTQQAAWLYLTGEDCGGSARSLHHCTPRYSTTLPHIAPPCLPVMAGHYAASSHVNDLI